MEVEKKIKKYMKITQNIIKLTYVTQININHVLFVIKLFINYQIKLNISILKNVWKNLKKEIKFLNIGIF